MKQLIAKTIVILAAIAAVLSIAHDFFANDTIGFFRNNPQLSLWLICFAVSGGLLVMRYDRMPMGNKRILRLSGIGISAALFTAALGYIAWYIILHISTIRDSDLLPQTTLILMLVAATATYLWIKFYQALKTDMKQAKEA